MIVVTATFAQEMDWWVADQGGGMQEFGSGDTMWASIGQTTIGERNAESTYLGAGYLYCESMALKIIEKESSSEAFTINTITPNPFKSSCMIEFEVPEKCGVTIDVYNIRGKRVKSLIESEEIPMGKYQARWAPTDLPAGLYLVQLKAGEKINHKSAVLMK